MNCLIMFCLAVVWLPFALVQSVFNLFMPVSGGATPEQNAKLMVTKIITTLIFAIIAIWLLKVFFWPCLTILAILFAVGAVMTVLQANKKP